MTDVTVSHPRRAGAGNVEQYLIVGAMFLFSIVSFGRFSSEQGSVLLALASIVSYFLAIYLYYGVARLALTHRNNLLWISGVLAVVAGYLLGGSSELWPLLTGWGMILFGGALSGRLIASGRKSGNVYLIAMIVVALFAILQLAPFWSFLMDRVREVTTGLLQEGQKSMIASGEGAKAVKGLVEDTQRMINVLIRLVPSMTVLAAVMQFSLGYLLFAYRLDPAVHPAGTLASFRRWKVPFWVMPALMVVILGRMFGPDNVKLAADNCIAFFCVFYCVCGLSLIEYYLSKYHFSRLMKVLFYIMLVFTQLIGFFAAALLGFVDSFADWRKIHRLSIVKE
jgi:hypothetical protein